MFLVLAGCHVQKGYEALGVYNYFDAKHHFEKGIERNTSPSAYGLSQIYFRNDNPFYDLDSAYHYGLLAVESYNDADEKKKEKWLEKADYSLEDAVEHRSRISDYFFEKAIDSNTVMAMKHFIAMHPWSSLKDSAVNHRDELAYQNAERKGTSLAYSTYIKQYPESHLLKEAKQSLHKAQFEETVVPNSISSYAEFISSFPTNPYVPEAQRRIYQLSTKKNSISEYEDYISRFPNSPFVEDAWKNLYRLSIADYTKESVLRFKEEHPSFPFPEMIKNDLNLVGKQLFLFKKNGGYGFMNRDGEVMIEAEYSFASNFSNGLAVIVCDDKYGYIDKSGDLVIDCLFDEAQDFNQGRAVVEKDGFFGLIDPTGDFVLPPQYLDIGSLNEGLFYVEDDNGFQYYTLDGSLAFNKVFDQAFAFENGLAKVNKGDKIGFIRKDGSFLVSSVNGDIRRFNDTLFVLKLRDSSTFLTPSEQVESNYYDQIGVLKENRAIVLKDGRYGYVDQNGNVVIEIEHEQFSNFFQFAQFENGHAKVFRQDRFALMDSLGKNILPAIFRGIGTYGRLIPVSKGDGWGYTDADVRLQIDYQFDYAYAFVNDLAIVELDGFVGLIDLEGEEVTPLQFEDLSRINQGYFIFKSQGRFGLMDATGKQVLQHTYQRISEVRSDLLRLEDQNGIAYFDITKNELITLKE